MISSICNISNISNLNNINNLNSSTNSIIQNISDKNNSDMNNIEKDKIIIEKKSNKEKRNDRKKNKRKDKRKDKKIEEINNKEYNTTTIKTSYSIDSKTQLTAIYKSFRQNYIFYIGLICCIYSFSIVKYNKSNIILSFITIIWVTLYGYFIHYVSHYMGTYMSELYKTYDTFFTRNKIFNWIATNLLYFGEFHSIVHHDSSINKTPKNIFLEFMNNIFMQGGAVIIIKYGLNLLDNRVIILWALYYATVHNINYNIKHPLTHQQHHINNTTNYGIDIWDIIIGSKYDWNEIETHNHTVINLIVITFIMWYFSDNINLPDFLNFSTYSNFFNYIKDSNIFNYFIQ